MSQFWLVLLISLVFFSCTSWARPLRRRGVDPDSKGWMVLIQDVLRSASTPPSMGPLEAPIRDSGLVVVSVMNSTRRSQALWALEGTQSQWEEFMKHPETAYIVDNPHRYKFVVSGNGYNNVVLYGSTKMKMSNNGVHASYAAGSWGLDRIDQHALPPDGLYNPGATGSGVNVYVVDTGVQLVTDLEGRVIQEYTAYTGDYNDCNGHGTHVSGIIGGTTYGVAKLATIRSYRVLDCSGSGSLGDLAQALFTITSAYIPPAVINLSLTYDGDDATIDSLVAQLLSEGITIVAAAGNAGESGCMYPAAITGIIAVGASTSNDEQASYSNFGTCLDIFAPGSSILSDWVDNETQILSGTSMASGFVSGGAALLLGNYPTALPSNVAAGLVASSTPNVLSGLGAGSPNRLLYVVDLQPQTASSPPPPPSPTTGTTTSSSAPPPLITISSLLLFLLLFTMF